MMHNNTITVETPTLNTSDFPTDILHFCPLCEPDGLEEQNIQVYIPNEDNSPDTLQAGQTQITNTTPGFVTTDTSVSNANYDSSDMMGNCSESAPNVDSCINQGNRKNRLGKVYNLKILSS